jgi:hypothetical protein
MPIERDRGQYGEPLRSIRPKRATDRGSQRLSRPLWSTKLRTGPPAKGRVPWEICIRTRQPGRWPPSAEHQRHMASERALPVMGAYGAGLGDDGDRPARCLAHRWNGRSTPIPGRSKAGRRPPNRALLRHTVRRRGRRAEEGPWKSGHSLKASEGVGSNSGIVGAATRSRPMRNPHAIAIGRRRFGPW